jgi:cellobiose phosphorylase
MYRLIVESLLGLRLEVDKLHIAPCLPADWKGFRMYYRYRETVYEIDVRQQPGGESRTIVTVDGMEQRDGAIPLVDDRRNRSVRIVLRVPPDLDISQR